MAAIRAIARPVFRWRWPHGDGHVLTRVRRTLLTICLVLAAVTAIKVWFVADVLPLRLCAIAALAGWAWWWVTRFRAGSFPIAAEPAEPLGAGVLVLAFDSVTATVGILFFVFLFRAFYGRRGVVVARVGLYLAAMAGAGLVVGGVSGALAALSAAPGLTGLAVLGYLVANRLARQDEAMVRERTLTGAGTSLQTAADRTAVYQTVTRVAADLLSGAPLTRCMLAVPSPDGMFQIEAASGHQADALVGLAVSPAALPPSLRAGKHDLRPIYAEQLDGQWPATGVPAVLRATAVLLVPLAVRGDLLGILTASADRPIPAEIHTSLHTLATQAALRLESIALTEQLTRMAFRDSLTGLPNRALIRQTIAGALARSRRSGQPAGLLLLDLDGFKQINDSLGHEAGDEVLVCLAGRLQRCLRAGDMVGRLGGDEFAVIAEDLTDERSVIVVAERILAAIRQPITIANQTVQVRASIGIALSNEEVDDPGDLLRNADTAMYRAKRRGTATYELYESGMHAAVVDRLRLENDLRAALDRDELTVHYQPIVALDTNKIHGVEALLRWHHPVRGPIPPGEFIAMAEETGLIVPIGQWVMEQACRQVSQWQRLPGCESLEVAVNLSPLQVSHASLVSDVQQVLRSSALTPGTLVLELTEGMLLRDMESSVLRLNELRALGVRIALDDFGTGFSSLGYLERFPIDILKIDRCFVAKINGDRSALAEVVIKLSQALGLDTVAEGIEDAQQLAALRLLGCQLGQGYLLARPAPAEQTGELLRPDRQAVGLAEQPAPVR